MLAFGFLFCCIALKIQKTKQFEFVRFVSLSERLMKNICIARSMDINFRSYGFVLNDLVRISLGIVSIQFEPLLTFIHFNFTLKQKQLPKTLIINKKKSNNEVWPHDYHKKYCCIFRWMIFNVSFSKWSHFEQWTCVAYVAISFEHVCNV